MGLRTKRPVSQPMKKKGLEMGTESNANGWTQWSKHVLLKLGELEKNMSKIYEAITELKVEIAMLKVKSGVWGLLGGLIPAAIAIIYILLKGK